MATVSYLSLSFSIHEVLCHTDHIFLIDLYFALSEFVVMTGDEDKSIVGGFQVSFRLQKDPNTYIGITRRGDSCGLVTHRPASALDGTQDRSVAWCPSNDFLVLN